jgi:hypothetical protein
MDLYLSQNTFEDELGPEQFQMLLGTHYKTNSRQQIKTKSGWIYHKNLKGN